MTTQTEGLNELLEKAASRPWTAYEDMLHKADGGYFAIVQCGDNAGQRRATARLIAAAVNAFPALLAERDKLAGEVIEARSVCSGHYDLQQHWVQEFHKERADKEAAEAKLAALVEALTEIASLDHSGCVNAHMLATAALDRTAPEGVGDGVPAIRLDLGGDLSQSARPSQTCAPAQDVAGLAKPVPGSIFADDYARVVAMLTPSPIQPQGEEL